jgi:hypothetical protein
MSPHTHEHDCPAIEVLSSSQGWQLGRGKYRAQQVHDSVIVFARGDNPTPNYQNRLFKGRTEVFPPQISLYQKAPTGIQVPSVTEFEICGTFLAREKVERITVIDSQGKHEREC